MDNGTGMPSSVAVMEKARELRRDEVKANPLLQDLLERAKAGGEQVITYEGLIPCLGLLIPDATITWSPIIP